MNVAVSKTTLIAGALALCFACSADLHAQESFGLNPDGTPLQQAPPIATLSTTTREVLLDVLVVDDKGHPVKGLKKEDFVLNEDGVQQRLRSFEEHSNVGTAETPNTTSKLPPNTFTNFTNVPNTNSSTVLLLDALDCGLPAQMYLHEQLLNYLKNMKSGTPIALFLLDSRMRLVQGFTTDPQILIDAVKSKRYGPVVPPLISGGEPAWRIRQEVRTAGMQTLGRYLAAFPGRKNLVWFTGYEPHKIIFGNATNNAFPDYGSWDELSGSADELQLSRVAIYPVDAGGLRVDPKYSAETSGRPLTGGTGFQIDMAAEQQHFDEIADRTGGKTYINGNDIKGDIAEIVENGEHYYTISYAPTSRNWYGQFRHIQLQTTMTGLNLQYRNGYYARNRTKLDQVNLVSAKNSTTTGEFHPAEEGQPHDAPSVLLKRAKLESLQASMTLGAITPTELIFHVTAAPSPKVEKLEKNDPLPQDNYLRPDFRKKPYRQYSLLYAIDAHNLRLSKTPDGLYHGEVEFVAVVYSDQGDVVNSLISKASLALTQGTYRKIMASGLTLKQSIAVPTKGNYFLRLGIHDVAGDSVGAIEIPANEIKLAVAEAGQSVAP